MKSKYVIQIVPNTRCPNCNQPVDMLCRADGTASHWPWFYICWHCDLILEVGKGEVKRDDCAPQIIEAETKEDKHGV